MARAAGTAAKEGRAPKTGGGGSHSLPGANGPSDDVCRAYVKQLNELDAKIEVLKKERSGIRKIAHGAGIELGLMDRRIKRQMWSPEEIQKDWSTERRYAELLGQPIGTQLELYGNEKTPEALKEIIRWKAIGRSHGLAGKGAPETPPDGCPPECRQPYGESWVEGQKETQDSYLRAAEKPAAAKLS